MYVTRQLVPSLQFFASAVILRGEKFFYFDISNMKKFTAHYPWFWICRCYGNMWSDKLPFFCNHFFSVSGNSMFSCFYLLFCFRKYDLTFCFTSCIPSINLGMINSGLHKLGLYLLTFYASIKSCMTTRWKKMYLFAIVLQKCIF